MPTQRRATQGQAEPEEPAQLSWQRQPARPRSKMRKVHNAAPNATAEAAGGQPPRTTPANGRRQACGRGAEINWGLYGRLRAGRSGAHRPRRRVRPADALARAQGGGDQHPGRRQPAAIAGQTIYDASGLEGAPSCSSARMRPRPRWPGCPASPRRTCGVRLPNQVIIDVQEEAPLVAWQGITTTVWLSAEGAAVPQEGAPPPLTLTDQTGAALADEPARVAGCSWPIWQRSRPRSPRPANLFLGKLEGPVFPHRQTACRSGWATMGACRASWRCWRSSQQELAATANAPEVIDLRFSDKQAFMR